MDETSCPEHDVPTLALSDVPVVPVDPEKLEGTMFADRYLIHGVVGSGGMGTIFVASQRSMKRKVALKVLHPELVRKGTGLTRFYRESRAVSLLDHPNIVRILDFGVDEKTFQPYIAMSLIEGRSLADVLQGGPIRETRAARILAQVSRALVTAHAKSVIHRDLKPENIMLQTLPEGTEHVTVLDFGVARVADDVDLRATRSGMIVGTPAYMAPEQISGGSAEIRSDLYSLGCILHECVTGRPPFDDPNAVACLLAHVSKDPPPLPEKLVNGEKPSAALDAMRLWLLAKDPERRPENAKIVLEVMSALGVGDQDNAARLLGIGLEKSRIDRSATIDDRDSFYLKTDLTGSLPPQSAISLGDSRPPSLPPLTGEFTEVVTPADPPDVSHSPREVAVRPDERGLLVRLPPVFDEHFDAKGLVKAISQPGPIVFDFDRVRRITSYGIREWSRFLKMLPEDRYFCFVRCRPSVVAQFNVLANFGDRGEMVSFYVPYFCPQCSEKMELLVDVRTEKERLNALEAPPLQCARCRVDAELEDVPEIYFHYVSEQPLPQPPREATQIIQGIGTRRARETVMGVTKEINEKLTIFRLRGIIDEKASFRRLAEGVEGIVLVDLAGVEELRGVGVERFLEFLAKTDCEIHLANARISMVQKLFEEPLAEQVRFATIAGTAVCPKCGRERDLKLAADLPYDDEVTGESSAVCCGAVLPGVSSLEARLLSTEGSNEVSRYLEQKGPRLA
jgi:serine/threonine protein kinase